ncbi:MAG: electron transfer flavoprotein subunit alpha/FixB family protein [Planctomycetes bacterium]|nr:electron transfer flavoprotein subunit alpha/FixB family protein [Planctomycetota bacterium]
MTKDIFVFVEQRNGAVLSAGLQALSAATQLAGKTGGNVVAGIIGHDLSAAAGKIDNSGATAVYVCDAEPLKNYNALKYTRALAGMIRKADPQIVLLAASFMGRDLAPRVAMRLDAGLATDCTEVDIEGGALIARRPIYNGKAYSRVHFNSGRVQIASVRPNTFPLPSGGGAAERIAFAFAADAADDRQVTKEIARTGGEEKDVTEASIVVSGGRSLKSEENFKILYDLAHALDGAVGASRAACDAGYQPHSRQVGLTGKTVTPQLYVACGISGAIQHLAGMRGSRRIVAVNTDAEAPIFKVADIGVVADLFTFVPLLTEEVKKVKGH